MLFKKKKPSLLKKLVVGSSVSVLTAYIGTELNKAIKRYEIKDKVIPTEHFRLKRKDFDDDVKQLNQRYYEFDIVDKNDETPKGLVQLLMGQEQDSFYGGHIRIKADNLNKMLRKEIDLTLITVAQNHLMSHLNFVCEKDDNDAKDYYQSLGAVFYKEIKVPEDSSYYIKGHNILHQYRLDLIDQNTKDFMERKNNKKKLSK